MKIIRELEVLSRLELHFHETNALHHFYKKHYYVEFMFICICFAHARQFVLAGQTGCCELHKCFFVCCGLIYFESKIILALHISDSVRFYTLYYGFRVHHLKHNIVASYLCTGCFSIVM